MGHAERVSPRPGDGKGPDKTSRGEVVNVELDRDHYAKLVILAGLWKDGSPAEMVNGFIDDSWEQLGEGIPERDLTLDEFKKVAENLLELEV